MNKKIIFVDDSGDPGFRGTSSRYFLMAAAVFDDIDSASKVDHIISDFRFSLDWKNDVEFKFRKTNKLIIKQLLKMITLADFQIYSVYVDKSRYPTVMPLINKRKFYNWLIEELLKIIPFNEARVMVDGAADKNTRLRTASYIRHSVNNDDKRIKSFKLVDSRRDNLIQLADLLAGILGRSLNFGKTDANDYIRIVRKKIVEFRRLDLDSSL